DHFIDAEMKSNRPDLKIKSAGYENISITEFRSRVDERFCLAKYRRLERDFEEVVGETDQPVAMHPTMSTEGKSVKQRTGIEIETEEKRHAQKDFRELIDAFQNRSVVARVIGMHRHKVAGQQRAVEIVERSLHKAENIIAGRGEFRCWAHMKNR